MYIRFCFFSYLHKLLVETLATATCSSRPSICAIFRIGEISELGEKCPRDSQITATVHCCWSLCLVLRWIRGWLKALKFGPFPGGSQDLPKTIVRAVKIRALFIRDAFHVLWEEQVAKSV
jgi:hypothetical protein